MKKILTLLFAVGTISIASAQSGNFGHNKQSVSFAENGKDKQIKQINREYDYKIKTVKVDRHLNGWEKSREIRSLENQRSREITALQFHNEKRMVKIRTGGNHLPS